MEILAGKRLTKRDERSGQIRHPDGRVFHGKNTMCGKRIHERNPMWLVNEIIYTHFAKKAGLRMPETCYIRVDGEIHFASHIQRGRNPMSKKPDITPLFNGENKVQLTKALLLDLSLLNSDRTAGNMLRDGQNQIWLYDHDKCLWGDGLPGDLEKKLTPPGDLDRIRPQAIEAKTNDFLSDYLSLHYPKADYLVFSDGNWAAVLSEFGRLPLSPEVLAEARLKLPDATWLSDELFERMTRFLPLWWARLTRLFAELSGPVELIGILKERAANRIATWWAQQLLWCGSRDVKMTNPEPKVTSRPSQRGHDDYQTDEADRGRHPGFARYECLAGGPGS